MTNVTRTMNSSGAYRAGAGIAAAAVLLVVWRHAAVATADDSPGFLLLGVLAVGLIGALIARFRPQAMARAMFATALAQAMVAVIAMIAWQQYVEISIVNGVFMVLWIGSALLFRKAARVSPGPGAM